MGFAKSILALKRKNRWVEIVALLVASLAALHSRALSTEPLHLKGVNYYAFGGAQAPNQFAARSDPGSPLYQAWFGAYAIRGGREIFSSNDQSKQFAWLAQLAEFDQKSWLGAMGDPQPEAKWTWHSAPKFETIDGAPRIMYHATMKSHSDISAPSPDSTPLAKMLGMPGATSLVVAGEAFSSYHPQGTVFILVRRRARYDLRCLRSVEFLQRSQWRPA